MSIKVTFRHFRTEKEICWWSMEQAPARGEYIVLTIGGSAGTRYKVTQVVWLARDEVECGVAKDKVD